MTAREFHIGDDPSGQTIYNEERMIAVGCTPETAAALVHRLNSEPARQEDIDLLMWLLAEKTNQLDHCIKLGDIVRKTFEESYDRVVSERDSARASLAFWGVVGGGS